MGNPPTKDRKRSGAIDPKADIDFLVTLWPAKLDLYQAVRTEVAGQMSPRFAADFTPNAHSMEFLS